MKTTLLFIISLILLSCSTSRNSFHKRKYSRNLFVKTNYVASQKEDHFEHPVIEGRNDVLTLPIAEIELIEPEVKSELVEIDSTESDKNLTSKEVPPFVRQFNSVLLDRPIIQRISQIDEKPKEDTTKKFLGWNLDHWLSLLFLGLAIGTFYIMTTIPTFEALLLLFPVFFFGILTALFKFWAVDQDRIDSESKEFNFSQLATIIFYAIIGVGSLLGLIFMFAMIS